MGSNRRQRETGVFVRVLPHERAWLDHRAAEFGCTPAELIRAIVFERNPVAVVPCSQGHIGCTTHHRDLVDGYRDQRYREELELEAVTGMHDTDIAIWRENGNRLTTFRDWLMGRTS